MSMVLTLILVVQMLSALVMIGLILIQHGKGADMGAAFVVAVRAVCLAPRAVPTFFRAPPLCWQPYFLSAPCCWLISATRVLQHRQAVFWKALPLPRQRPLWITAQRLKSQAMRRLPRPTTVCRLHLRSKLSFSLLIALKFPEFLKGMKGFSE